MEGEERIQIVSWDRSLEETATRFGHDILPGETAAEYLERKTLTRLMRKKGGLQLLILVGSSGVGKEVIQRSLEGRGVFRIPRITTRKPRPDEFLGLDLTIVDHPTFDLMERRGLFVSHNRRHGERYGILRTTVEMFLIARLPLMVERSPTTLPAFYKDPILQGVSRAVVYLLPPNGETLFERLRVREARQGISTSHIARRLELSRDEFSKVDDSYDAFVVNDDVVRVVNILIPLFASIGHA